MTDQTREDEIRKTIKGGEDIGWDDTDFLLRILDEARRERDGAKDKWKEHGAFCAMALNMELKARAENAEAECNILRLELEGVKNDLEYFKKGYYCYSQEQENGDE